MVKDVELHYCDPLKYGIYESNEHGIYMSVYDGALIGRSIEIRLNDEEIAALRRGDHGFFDHLRNQLVHHPERFADRTFRAQYVNGRLTGAAKLSV